MKPVTVTGLTLTFDPSTVPGDSVVEKVMWAVERINDAVGHRLGDEFALFQNEDATTWETCDNCGEQVEELTICPNGMELCEYCFEAGVDTEEESP